MRIRATAGRLFAAACVIGCSVGCESAPKQKTAQERQDEALRDPFRYKPDFSDSTVSDGDPNKLDKDGLKKDLGHVLMP